MDTLSYTMLVRPGKQLRHGTQTERHSIDFQINGQSLLQLLVAHSVGHSDYMGCIVHGFAEENAASIGRLLLRSAPDTPAGRVRIYQCPECGHISCGLYSVRIEQRDSAYIWYDFAYESDYVDNDLIPPLGPFRFDVDQYQGSIAACAVYVDTM